jgi:cytochrome c oxidase subunit 2
MDPSFAHHALDVAGPQAAHIAWLWWLTVGVCAAVLAGVLIALAIALRRGRAARTAAGPESDAADLTSLTTSESRLVSRVTAATLAAVALLVVLIVASVFTDRALARLDLGDALHVQITARQWWWNVRYDDPDPSKIFETANELHLPVGRPVVVSLNADDVIHSFWVPNLHGKKDLIPGQTATLRLRADRPGKYRGLCAEFCGLQHAWMDYTVVAEAPAQYEAWAAAQRKDAPEPADDEAKRGRELFLSGSCMMCHAIQGTTAGGHNAPDLTHVASRPTIGAGVLKNDAANLARWISDPQQFKPGVNMPAHPLPAEDMKALVSYLGTLK